MVSFSILHQFQAKVYTWMSAMLGLTAVAAYTATQTGITAWFFHHPLVFMGALIFEVILVGAFAGFRASLSFPKGLGLVGLYTVLTGLTLSVALTQYTTVSLGLAFGAATLVFLFATIYGLLGKNLARLQGWLIVGLLALVASLIVGVFLHSALFDLVVSSIAVILFTILAAFDAQMIRDRGIRSPTNLDALDCALEVYLDFINLFIHLLRLLGVKTKDD